MNRAASGRVVVLGVGNLLLGDEGVGVHVARELLTRDLPGNVEVIDAGTMPVEGLGAVADVAKLVIVDAIRGAGPPGAMYRLPVSAVASKSGQLSLHEMSMSDALAYWTTAGLRAEQIVIIGVQPHTMDWSCELSATLREKLPAIVSTVIGEAICERTEGHDS